MLPNLSPLVLSNAVCQLWADGTQCLKPTGSDLTKPGIDADLCPEHRAVMQAQRVENAKPRVPTDQRLAALEALPVVAMNKPKA